jgi:hypothetical protein
MLHSSFFPGLYPGLSFRGAIRGVSDGMDGRHHVTAKTHVA